MLFILYSGWVQTVYYYNYPSNESQCLLKARVRGSQRSTVFHEAWVAVEQKDGKIRFGHCTCMAGYESVILHYVHYDNSCGEVCSHVAAILFKVEACTRLELAKQTCTSLPCTWNQVFCETVSDIMIFNHFYCYYID